MYQTNVARLQLLTEDHPRTTIQSNYYVIIMSFTHANKVGDWRLMDWGLTPDKGVIGGLLV